MNTSKMLAILPTLLLVVGGLNWGLVAMANFVLVAALTGAGGFGARNVSGAVAYRPVSPTPACRALTWNRSRRAAA